MDQPKGGGLDGFRAGADVRGAAARLGGLEGDRLVRAEAPPAPPGLGHAGGAGGVHKKLEQAVWAALRQIPYGETRSYKDIARAIGHPKAFRAVGMANNRNPILIAIPCHRVIGADGGLVGYGGGLEMKQALLKLEKGR